MGANRSHEISPRGRACLRGVHRGLTSKEIALELGIAEGTVTGYIRDAVAILGAPNRRAAARQLFGDPSPGVAPPDDLPPPDLPSEDPQQMGERSPGVGAAPPPPPEPGERGAATPWWGLLDVADRGVANDLGIIERVVAILVLAIGLVGGFGILAAAVRTLSDLVGRGGGGG